MTVASTSARTCASRLCRLASVGRVDTMGVAEASSGVGKKPVCMSCAGVILPLVACARMRAVVESMTTTARSGSRIGVVAAARSCSNTTNRLTIRSVGPIG